MILPQKFGILYYKIFIGGDKVAPTCEAEAKLLNSLLRPPAFGRGLGKAEFPV